MRIVSVFDGSLLFGQLATRHRRGSAWNSVFCTTRGTLTWVGEPPRRTSTTHVHCLEGARLH